MLYFHFYVYGNEIVRKPSGYDLPNFLLCLLIYRNEKCCLQRKILVIQKYTKHPGAKTKVNFRKALLRAGSRESFRYMQFASQQASCKFKR